MEAKLTEPDADVSTVRAAAHFLVPAAAKDQPSRIRAIQFRQRQMSSPVVQRNLHSTGRVIGVVPLPLRSF